LPTVVMAYVVAHVFIQENVPEDLFRPCVVYPVNYQAN